jgi:hypothetical protein
VTERPVKTFYRATKRYPPTDKDYLTRQERQGNPPPNVPQEVRDSWDALSFYDTFEGIERQIRLVPAIGRHIVRYDIPEGSGITWNETQPPGHFDIRGDKELLKQCLVDRVGYIEDA